MTSGRRGEVQHWVDDQFISSDACIRSINSFVRRVEQKTAYFIMIITFGMWRFDDFDLEFGQQITRVGSFITRRLDKMIFISVPSVLHITFAQAFSFG
jgi:hypothetical protein